MKKIIYTFLLALAATLTITACTEEEIKPSTELNGGGNASTDKGF